MNNINFPIVFFIWIRNRILSILWVLKSTFSYIKCIFLILRICISLTKLLKTKTSMPHNLMSNISGSFNFYASTSHLKWAPVGVLDKVAYEPFGRFSVVLVRWVRYTG